MPTASRRSRRTFARGTAACAVHPARRREVGLSARLPVTHPGQVDSARRSGTRSRYVERRNPRWGNLQGAANRADRRPRCVRFAYVAPRRDPAVGQFGIDPHRLLSHASAPPRRARRRAAGSSRALSRTTAEQRVAREQSPDRAQGPASELCPSCSCCAWSAQSTRSSESGPYVRSWALDDFVIGVSSDLRSVRDPCRSVIRRRPLRNFILNPNMSLA